VTGGSSFETILHGKVTGIFGTATSCVQSIGVLTSKVEDLPARETIIVQEAWGGQGGESFYEGSGDVIEVVVSYNDRHVVSLQTTYKRGGKTFKASQHGGQNGAGAKQAKVRESTLVASSHSPHARGASKGCGCGFPMIVLQLSWSVESRNVLGRRAEGNKLETREVTELGALCLADHFELSGRVLGASQGQ